MVRVQVKPENRIDPPKQAMALRTALHSSTHGLRDLREQLATLAEDDPRRPWLEERALKADDYRLGGHPLKLTGWTNYQRGKWVGERVDRDYGSEDTFHRVYEFDQTVLDELTAIQREFTEMLLTFEDRYNTVLARAVEIPRRK